MISPPEPATAIIAKDHKLLVTSGSSLLSLNLQDTLSGDYRHEFTYVGAYDMVWVCIFSLLFVLLFNFAERLYLIASMC